MTRHLILFIFLVIFNNLVAQQSNVALMMRNSFKVIGYKQGKISKTGSGFIIGSYSQNSGFINLCVSNAHVLENLDSAYILFSNDDQFLIKSFIHSNRKLDLAFFTFSSKNKFHDLFKTNSNLTDLESSIGEDIITISSPKGLTNSLSSGLVSGVRRIGSQTLLQFTAPISSGSSGGLLAKKTGIPIGIIVSQFSEGQNINFAIPFQYAIQELLNSNFISKDLSRFFPKEYLLSSMDDYLIKNDSILNDAWNSRNNDQLTFEKLSKINNEDLTEMLLFLKFKLNLDRQNWYHVFQTAFFTWNKYKSKMASFMLIAVANEFNPGNSKASNSKRVFRIQALSDLASKDELSFILYSYVKGAISVINDNYESLEGLYSPLALFIDEHSSTTLDSKDNYDEAADNLAFVISQPTYLSLGIHYAKRSDFHNSLKCFQRNLKYALPNENQYYAKLVIQTHIVLKDYQSACDVFKKYYTNSTQLNNSDMEMIINYYCQ